MSNFMSWLLLLASIPNVLLIYIAVQRFTSRNIADGHIRFDYDRLQAELDEEFNRL